MLGILGGSFDPIHNGHLVIANTVYKKLGLTTLYFLPCGQHGSSKLLHASKADRLTMLQLALNARPHFRIDCQELHRHGPSYAVDTLKNFRARLGRQQSLIWIIGYDVLLTLPQWKQWQAVLHYCHLVVVSRKVINNEPDKNFKFYINQHITDEIESINSLSAGKIYLLNLPTIAVSSTQIREQLNQGLCPGNTLPAQVLAYIKQRKLYSD